MSLFSKYFALPTWILYRINSPFFPKDHPWKDRNFSLEEWYANETELSEQFDEVFWLSFLLIGVCIATILIYRI